MFVIATHISKIIKIKYSVVLICFFIYLFFKGFNKDKTKINVFNIICKNYT